VLQDLLRLLAAYAIAFLVNLPPAFMPATWMVLAFFRVQYGLPLLPLTIGGAFFSTGGRFVLARGTTLFKQRFMKHHEELDEIGEYLDERRNYVGVATFIYCLLPLPSNNFFIAAGLVEVSMLRVLVGFWIGRAVSYTFYVWTADRVFSAFGNVFQNFYDDWTALLFEVLSLAGALLLILLPWPHWVMRYISRSHRRDKTGVR